MSPVAEDPGGVRTKARQNHPNRHGLSLAHAANTGLCHPGDPGNDEIRNRKRAVERVGNPAEPIQPFPALENKSRRSNRRSPKRDMAMLMMDGQSRRNPMLLLA